MTKKTDQASAFEALFAKAHTAGHAAATACVPDPMVVVDSARCECYHVSDGVCGFAWINIKPGGSAFARFLKARSLARTDSYYGGVTVWAGDYGQSMERKEAYARAFAAVLREAGINAYSHSRMD